MRCLLSLLLPAIAFGQAVSFGVKAGVPLTDAYSVSKGGASEARRYFSSAGRYTVGPTAELKLPAGAGIEVNALYKRQDFGWSATQANALLQAETSSSSWEFPVLLKVRMPGVLFRPYGEAGMSFRTLRGVKQTLTTELAGRTTTVTDTPEELNERAMKGFVLGGGIEVKAPVVRVSAELRYTRWSGEAFRGVRDLLHSTRNQAEFLVGVAF